MSENMEKFLSELCEYLLGHGKERAACELADMMDNEETTTE